MRDGVRLGAAALGPTQATVGVVLAHGASQTLCDWLTEADRIVSGAQVRILIPDRRGVGSSEGTPDAAKYSADMVEAALWLQAHGTSQIVLIGSSYGAPIAVTAGQGTGEGVSPKDSAPGPLKPPACAVVAISPARSIEEGTGSIQPLKISSFAPRLWIAAEEGRSDIVGNARALFSKLGSDKKEHFLLIPGTDHSLGLVQNHPDVRNLIQNAVRECFSN
ncbi:alpha/beta hydrolase [Microtetraspora sp. NBRC 16547]|uniref:alpha/beta hydrolase n=1 Tax=Microtetraspora sp. NBRC 16547 TaxID=3030993 RepID=UPI0024A0D7BF|nr:alpha/beta hydrolase [Microtetraspora sp. NBRC 16547]GLX02130.1 hypothetical protein Misp02_62160 [Microtetraspora sp. NBRC 16547]